MITNEQLEILIRDLTNCKADGVADPWLLSDGTSIEPLDVLVELRQLREALEFAGDNGGEDVTLKAKLADALKDRILFSDGRE